MVMKKGFTIVEVVVTMSVVVIMAYVFVSSYSHEPTILTLAEEKLVSDIRYAKYLALTRGATHGVFFEPQAERYTVFVGSTTTPVLDPAHTGQNLVVRYTAGTQFVGVDMVSADFGGTATLLFNARGTPQSSTGTALTVNGQVVITNGSGGSRTITVVPETGKVTGS